MTQPTSQTADERDDAAWRYDGLRALYINCTLKRSPERSHTQGLIDRSRQIMERHGVAVSELRAVDHEIATGVWPDMTEHGWDRDAWPQLFPQVLAADILVLCGPIWLGDNSSVMKLVTERLYGCSHPATPSRRRPTPAGSGRPAPARPIWIPGRAGRRTTSPTATPPSPPGT